LPNRPPAYDEFNHLCKPSISHGHCFGLTRTGWQRFWGLTLTHRLSDTIAILLLRTSSNAKLANFATTLHTSLCNEQLLISVFTSGFRGLWLNDVPFHQITKYLRFSLPTKRDLFVRLLMKRQMFIHIPPKHHRPSTFSFVLKVR
jgi:hypothetical protein